MKFQREAQKHLIKLAKTFRAVAVVGPRQSGKSTLVKSVFKDRPYLSFENTTMVNQFRNDPEYFIQYYKTGCVIDEVQKVPEIFSYLQLEIDRSNKKGRFILTGSSNFTKMESVTQTLAGRLVFVDLLPLSVTEINTAKANLYKNKWENFVWRGGYPEPAQLKSDLHTWFDGYFRTYVERDIRQLKQIDNIPAFQRLIYLCAGRVGQQINYASLATEVGVNATTIQTWLDVLQTNYLIYFLKPYFNNFNKRIVKAPKLYFTDTGLASWLLSIQSPSEIEKVSLYKGALFENFVINEMLKNRFNAGKKNNLYYFKDSNGNEIDLIVDNGKELLAVEIKSAKTLATDFFKGLDYWKKISGYSKGYLIYNGIEEFKYSNGNHVLNWRNGVFI
jgi:predicted AAA+ superfamily ATPase